jgi:hypothetical protein
MDSQVVFDSIFYPYNCSKNRLTRPRLYYTHYSTVREVAVLPRRSNLSSFFLQTEICESPRDILYSQGLNKIRGKKMPYDLVDWHRNFAVAIYEHLTLWCRVLFEKLLVWHRSFKFNSNKSPTWCNNFSVYCHDICLQLNMFRAFSRPSSGAQWLQWQPLVLPSYRGDNRAVFVVGSAGWPARPWTQHNCHHDTKVKPEAATVVIELLMMGGKTPKTCWAVNRLQDNKLKNCCIRLVIYLNCTMMHGLTNLKVYI